MQPREEVSGGLLIACGNASKLLDYAEEALDEVAFAIEREIAIAFDLTIGFWRYHGFDRARDQAVDETVSIVSLVA